MTDSVIMLLTGPLQSWGGPAPGVYERPTEAMPSLSGVVGIIANAFGRKRTDPIDDIASGASLAVRADRPGVLVNDFHTIGTPGRYALVADSARQSKNPVPTRRRYLADAAFLAVYTPPPHGKPADEVLDALLNPVRPLYLGRRSCTPSERIAVSVTADKDPEQILTAARVLRDPGRRSRQAPTSDADFYALADSDDTVQVLIEMTADPQTHPHRGSARKDAPATFDPRRLYHLDRFVVTKPVRFSLSACAGRGREAVAALYESLGAVP